MPHIQPKLNNYFGFMPVASAGTIIPCNSYQVSSSEGTAINLGDVVCQTSLGTVRVITGAFIATSSMAIVGVAASGLAANGGSTGSLLNANTSQNLLVYDAPNQQYVVCDTTSASAGPITALYKNYAILASGAIGSTGPNPTLGRSVMAISGTASTAAGSFHILALHPIENGQYSSGGAGVAVTSSGVSKWIGVFNTGVTLQSTALTSIQNTTS